MWLQQPPAVPAAARAACSSPVRHEHVLARRGAVIVRRCGSAVGLARVARSMLLIILAVVVIAGCEQRRTSARATRDSRRAGRYRCLGIVAAGLERHGR